MHLPDYDRVLFGRSPLKLVIGQIRFPPLFRFEENSFLAPFREAIQSEYPRAKKEQQMAIKLLPNKIENTGETLWRFSDREEQWSVVLGVGALTLESRLYSSMSEFESRFNKILDAAVEYLSIKDRIRLGLRFINELRSEEGKSLAQWANLLNPEFVGFAATELLGGTVEHAFHEIRSKRTDGMLVIRHGLLAGTSIPPRPGDNSTNMGRFYLIDLDYFDDNECEVDITKTISQLRAYDIVIYRFFRWSIEGGTIYQQLEPSQ